ncbi:hypothetical protein [Anaerosacchariphilus polymeriproducens]|uniref:DUF5666 domain-containing protein n=1 Tax=Anaerosacchariphilus polymeriproducens TaxID=1812858 RepID=A0A371AX52_9FIRM|nr:hypothetical protein [Anaerosacchariphilus polymeriproducens]RDU24158.1 hypothetical protein DWV06_05515 [Anaerosacchariphilus polymeriproducens]
MKKTKKFIVFLIVNSFIIIMVVGCSDATKDSSSNENIKKEDTAKEEIGTENQTKDEISMEKGNGVSGQVTKVDGKEITLAVNKMGAPPQNEKRKGEEPDSKDVPKDDQEKPSKDEMPEMKTEEQVITIEDESIIYVKDGETESKGSLEDIEVGKILKITYTKKDDVIQEMEKIIVMSQTSKDKNQEEQNPSDKQPETNQNNI